MSDSLKQLRADLEKAKIDRDLLWECLYSYQDKLLEFGNSMVSYVSELFELLEKHQKEDCYFKTQLSETHKQYYEKFESLFLKIKQLFGKQRPKSKY